MLRLAKHFRREVTVCVPELPLARPLRPDPAEASHPALLHLQLDDAAGGALGNCGVVGEWDLWDVSPT